MRADPILRPRRRREQRRHGARITDPTERLGRHAAEVRIGGGQQIAEHRHRLAIAPQANTVDGDALDARIGIAQGATDGGARGRQRQAHRRPQRALSQFDGRGVRDRRRERGHGAVRTEPDQRLAGAAPYGRPRIGKTRRHRLG